MSVSFAPHGAYTALVTPFTHDGAFDDECFLRLVRFQMAEGITGLVPCGTTGESPTLTWREHDEIVHLAIRAADGRVPILAGTGSNSTEEAIRGTLDAKSAGASAALLVDCYYNGPSTLELRTEYYERVLESVEDIPIVPYVIPGRSGCALSAEDLALLHLDDPTRVPAVKQATGDLARMRRDRELAGQGLAILSGDDALTLRMMQDPGIGAAGVISVMSNLLPGAVTRMVTAQAEGDSASAEALAASLAPLFDLVGVSCEREVELPDGRVVETLDKFRNPLPVKTMMAGLGMVGSTCRRPLGLMTAGAVLTCRDALRALWRAAPDLLRPIEAAFDVSVEARLEDDDVWSHLTV